MKKVNGKLIRTKGLVEIINGTDFQLDELQRYVDGCIEIIDLHNGCTFIIDEKGKFTKEMNTIATFIARKKQAIAKSLDRFLIG